MRGGGSQPMQIAAAVADGTCTLPRARRDGHLDGEPVRTVLRTERGVQAARVHRDGQPLLFRELAGPEGVKEEDEGINSSLA